MERRFVLFIVLSMAVMIGYSLLTEWFLPAPPRPKRQIAETESKSADSQKAPEKESPEKERNEHQPESERPAQPTDTAEQKPSEQQSTEDSGDKKGNRPDPNPKDSKVEVGNEVSIAPQWLTLGSCSPTSPYLVHATFSNRGAALECVELTERENKGRLRFRNLEDPHGYLGYLALRDAGNESGSQINSVGDGTPAALAKCSDNSIAGGLQPGDVIRRITLSNRTTWPISKSTDVAEQLRRTHANDAITLRVERRMDNKKVELDFVATLGVRPLEIISPESSGDGAFAKDQPLSCLVSLATLDNLSVELPPELAKVSNELRDGNWTATRLDNSSGVEFRKTAVFSDPKRASVDSKPDAPKVKLEFVKRYRIQERTADSSANKPPYQIDLELEIHNRSENLQRVSYRLDGPNGLPVEGWWYLSKIHPAWFQTAGARDVIWKTEGEGRRLLGTSEIHTHAKKNPKASDRILFAENQPLNERSLAYIGIDTQYFLAALTPQRSADQAGVAFRHAAAKLLHDPNSVEKDRIRTSNTTFELVSQPVNIEPGQFHAQRFELFTGPKQPAVLAAHGLDDTIEYGWFPWVVKPLSGIVHFFYQVVGNWGIAIILLTILVRGCMFPLSRKAAVNAQMMQQLAPEMKKITEKYKNDMEKRAVEQRKLFKMHNYNPFGGCWMVFIQIPIFIGLYRCLAIDIDLRQSALFPGIEWCSNLAGPDKLLPWTSFVPTFLSSETGWLGPFLNVLPIITIALFLVQQKLFTPPPTDEQTQMQVTMMKYMTIFMGIMFYKVPAGLCIYFIVSSLWSIGERKLIPKPKVPPLEPRTPPPEPKGDSWWERMLKLAEQMAEDKKANEKRGGDKGSKDKGSKDKGAKDNGSKDKGTNDSGAGEKGTSERGELSHRKRRR